MRFRLSGDIVRSFTIEIEADCEQDALDIVEDMTVQDLKDGDSSFSDGSIVVESIVVNDIL